MRRDPRLACPNLDQHEHGPDGYLAWHSWAEERRKEGWKQSRCPRLRLLLHLHATRRPVTPDPALVEHVARALHQQCVPPRELDARRGEEPCQECRADAAAAVAEVREHYVVVPREYAARLHVMHVGSCTYAGGWMDAVPVETPCTCGSRAVMESIAAPAPA